MAATPSLCRASEPGWSTTSVGEPKGTARECRSISTAASPFATRSSSNSGKPASSSTSAKCSVLRDDGGSRATRWFRRAYPLRRRCRSFPLIPQEGRKRARGHPPCKWSDWLACPRHQSSSRVEEWSEATPRRSSPHAAGPDEPCRHCWASCAQRLLSPLDEGKGPDLLVMLDRIVRRVSAARASVEGRTVSRCVGRTAARFEGERLQTAEDLTRSASSWAQLRNRRMSATGSSARTAAVCRNLWFRFRTTLVPAFYERVTGPLSRLPRSGSRAGLRTRGASAGVPRRYGILAVGTTSHERAVIRRGVAVPAPRDLLTARQLPACARHCQLRAFEPSLRRLPVVVLVARQGAAWQSRSAGVRCELQVAITLRSLCPRRLDA